MKERKGIIIILLAILAIGAFLRFHLLTEFPLGLFPDEAMNGNNALEALDTFRNFDISKFRVFYPENNGREGLFINIQAISILIFGNEPWALRLVSAVFGTLTLLGIYLLTRELFHQPPQIQNAKIKNQNNNSKSKIFNFSLLSLNLEKNGLIALLASFFLATSYWHLNFSRIGFRAITVPFFSIFALYFLLKGLRRGKIQEIVYAGIFTGLGFYTYIAFRFFPVVILLPIMWHIREWMRPKGPDKKPHMHSCAPCLIILFLFITFVVSLPLAFYFFENPEDFLGRTGQVSVLSSASPLFEFIKSNAITLGMLFVWGDCNWRHNYACQPELNLIVMPFFAIGFLVAVLSIIKPVHNFQFSIFPPEADHPSADNFQSNSKNSENLQAKLPLYILLVWLIAMSLPATLTREGLPHALRAIGMIPPVMIMAGYGAWLAIDKILSWIGQRYANNDRLKKEMIILFTLALLWIPLTTYRNYFVRWAQHPKTYYYFSTDVLHIGQFLKTLPRDEKKYVIVETPMPRLREVGTPAQTVMFITDTFLEEKMIEKNYEYITREEIDRITIKENEKVIIAFFTGKNTELIKSLKQKFPILKEQAPQDFVVLKNY